MESLVTFTSVAALAAVIYTAVNLIKYVRARDWNGAVTIVVAAVVGVLIVWLASEAEVTENLQLIEDGEPLGQLDFASLVIAGVALASLSSAFTDLRKSFDNTATAEKPSLLPAGTANPPHVP